MSENHRSCPHLAKPYLANFSVLVFWPNYLVLLLCVVVCCCVLLCVVVAWCCLLLLGLPKPAFWVGHGLELAATIPPEDPLEREERRERKKKARNFGSPTIWAPTLRAPLFLGSGHHPSGPPPLRTPHNEHATQKNWPNVVLAKCGQMRMAKSGLAKFGRDQIIQDPKSVARTSRWPCEDYLRGTCKNLFCEKWHPPECLF